MFWLNMGSDVIADGGEKSFREFPGLKSVLLTGRKVLAKAAVRSENALLFRSPVTERQPRSLIVCPHHL